MIIHIGDEREILLTPVAPLRLIVSRVSSRKRMFPLAMGANSYSQLVRPLGESYWLMLVVSQRILHPPHEG